MAPRLINVPRTSWMPSQNLTTTITLCCLEEDIEATLMATGQPGYLLELAQMRRGIPPVAAIGIRSWPPHRTPSTDSKGGPAHHITNEAEPQVEFDEYGTELHRDARVWKVYVQETDEYDAELVKAWNDSTDVILIFAALFSAISTAFLIETSKMLQPDPADISARTLGVISQALITLANGSQPAGSMAQSPNNSTEFIPSRTAIYVNTLWYLSLSLSLATSFIAILSKDWCHSFMSGRTGHHYTQTCRRQQKWDMLEQWKMAELLAVLPSMIHVALLLFSFGLCILLWEINGLVATPVICVSGIAFGFYAWSSVTAIVLDFFPYPTMVSRLCRTESAQLTFRFTYQVVTELAVPLTIQSLARLAWWIIYLVARPPELLVRHSIPLFWKLSRLDRPGNSMLFTVHAFVSSLARKALDWLQRRSLYRYQAATWINSWFPMPSLKLKWTKLETKNGHSGDKPDLGTGEQTVLALSWLIRNCEVPQSVDIALQSIAGATNRMSPQPLLECQAPLQILRRLASSNFYRRLDSKSEAVEALYLRALSFLKTSANQTPGHQTSAGTEYQALIWDLQVEIEKKLAVLIEKGDFDPTRSNLEALRLGSTVASTSQKILKTELPKTDIRKIFGSITNLMKSHLEGTDVLHDAAVLSLAHAATLVLLLAPISIAGQHNPDSLLVSPVCSENGAVHVEEREVEGDFIDALAAILLCFQLSNDPRYSKLVTGLSNTCKFLFDMWIAKLQTGQSYALTWYERTLRRLVEEYAQGRMALELVNNLVTPEVSALQQTNNSADYISRLQTDLLAQYLTGNPIALPVIGAQLEGQAVADFHEDAVPSISYVLVAIGNFGPATALNPVLYLFVVEVMCRSPPSSRLFACGAQILSKYPFPALSEELTAALEQRDLVPLLEITSTSDNSTRSYFAKGQLWLLLSLYVYDTASRGDKLKVQLEKCRSSDESEEGRHWDLGIQLVEEVYRGSICARELGIWGWRLAECVRQSLGYTIWEYVHEALRDVPPELRGLSSFTAWPRRVADPPTNELRTINTVTDEVQGLADVIGLTIEGEGATGGDDYSQRAGLVADTRETGTWGEEDLGSAKSSQGLKTTTRGGRDGAGISIAEFNRRAEISRVQGEGNSRVEIVADERRVADAATATRTTDGPQSEGEEAQAMDFVRGGGNEGDTVIEMDRLDSPSDRPVSRL